MKRGITISLLLAMLVAGVAVAQSEPELPLDRGLGISTIPLWSGAALGSNGTAASAPTLTLFAPFWDRINGTAIIIAPGGGYRFVMSNLEGRQIADWFAARGVTAFVLKYRLGAQNLFPIPLEDAQRAIRFVRSNAAKYHIAPDRIGIIGFSAGGHLAAATATLFDSGNPNAPDPVDRVSDRPDFMILGYAWLNAMEPSIRGMITYCSVLKIPEADCKKFEKPYTPSLHVTANTPPAFIYATSEDKVVPVQASVNFYEALLNAGVSAEMHLFAHGEHGSGLGSSDPALDRWPPLLEQWLRGLGLLPRPDPKSLPRPPFNIKKGDGAQAAH